MASGIEATLPGEAAATAAVAEARMAKYANQPANTKRMYIGYQQEWQVRRVYWYIVVILQRVM